MVRYGKIDPATGYLMTCDKELDATWLPLTSFATDVDGDTYEYYKDASTPDLSRCTTDKARTELRDAVSVVNGFTVDYKAHNYYANEPHTLRYYRQMFSLEGKPANSTVKVITSGHRIVALDKADLSAIIALAEAEYAKAIAHIKVEHKDSIATP